MERSYLSLTSGNVYHTYAGKIIKMELLQWYLVHEGSQAMTTFECIFSMFPLVKREKPENGNCVNLYVHGYKSYTYGTENMYGLLV